MTFPRLSLLICILSIWQSYCYAQDNSNIQFGKVSTADFNLPNIPIIDSNTDAVILSNVGTIHFVGNKRGWFSYVYKKQTRIKILNKHAFHLATVDVDLYVKGDDPEKMDNLSATTYNLENGKVTETKLDKNEVFEDRNQKDHIFKKFTMPAVKEGSIFEYTYTITSPYDFILPAWDFQSPEYPCLWSQYKVEIPQTLSYVFVRQGVHPFDVDKSGTGSDSYRVAKQSAQGSLMTADGGDYFVHATTIKHEWAMKNVPAFHIENYLSSPYNYLDRIEFQLSKTYNGQEFSDAANNWKKATEELMNDESFAGALNNDNYFLDATVDKLAGGITDSLELAKAIYYYVSKHIVCINRNDKFIRSSLKEVFQKNNGDVGEINLLLIAMLRKKGIVADPVLLSTREYGFNLVNYPVMERLNYVITRAKVGGTVYFLDPAHRDLGFGRLAGNCYNGHARIISNVDSGSVYFYADSLKESRMTMVLLGSNPKGELVGSFQTELGDQESYKTREQIRETGEKAFFKRIRTSFGDDIEMDSTSIDSLNNPEEPVKYNYDFKLKQSGEPGLIYINPMFAEAYRENPFKAAERKYPVEMPYAMDYTYILSMNIPIGYDVDELPKSARVVMNGEEGLFEYLIQKSDNLIQLRSRVRLNKANFATEDYNSLRDFFAFIVKKESETIVLKKKS